MSELENTVVPTLANDLDMWTRYVDDTFAFMKANQQTEVLRKPNSFHPSIQFTYEKEKNKSISFSDVFVERDSENKLNTSVYRKCTSNDIYINWYAHAPNTWKIATLRNLLLREHSRFRLLKVLLKKKLSISRMHSAHTTSTRRKWLIKS